MAQPTINTVTNEYTFGRGNLFFDPLVDGIYEGYRPFGNCPGFTVSVATDKFEHFNSQGGIGQKDLDKVIKIDRKAQIVCDNLSASNFALFLSGTEGSVVQASTPVTDETFAVVGNRSYQLGATTINPAGVRGVSSVTARSAAGANAASAATATAYAVGAVVVPATPNTHYYIATVAGTSGGSAPTWKTDGTDTTDGTVTWKDLGLITPANVNSVDWKLDAALALLSTVPGGAFALAATAFATYGGASFEIEVDYTPAANTREQIRTTGSSELNGRLKFIADNPIGKNRDLFCASVSLSPSGDIPLITENDVASMTFDIGINELNSDTAAIYIDGRPV